MTDQPTLADLTISAKFKACQCFPKRVYEGIHLYNYCLVRVNGVPLDPRLSLKNFNQSFEWGCLGEGAKQLAYALLVDLFGDEKLEVISAYHEKLLNEIISQLPTQENWLITDTDILSILGGESDFNTQLSRYCRH